LIYIVELFDKKNTLMFESYEMASCFMHDAITASINTVGAAVKVYRKVMADDNCDNS